MNDNIINSLIEVTLAKPDDFLKVKESLTRIGVASKKDQKLFQSCLILHKQGKYYIVHFLEMFALDGRPTNIENSDIQRRNTIASLLQEWGLLKVVDQNKILDKAPISQIKIVSFKDKLNWELISKYTIGNKKPEPQLLLEKDL